MSVKGKRMTEWVARTRCDFGEKDRVALVRSHFSEEAAMRCFDDLSKIYGIKGRCWQETKDGRIINDNCYSG